jgi:hypothetical protein
VYFVHTKVNKKLLFSTVEIQTGNLEISKYLFRKMLLLDLPSVLKTLIRFLVVPEGDDYRP